MRDEGQLAWAAIDFLCCLLLVVYTLIAPTPVKAKPAIDTFGAYAVTLTWPGRLDADLDLYVQSPTGSIVWFGSRDGDGLHLEHDDLGRLGDTTRYNGERIVVTSTAPGEYVVNVHGYRTQAPVTGRVELWRLRGHDTRLRVQRVTVGMGQEQTAFRFTVRPDGQVGGYTRLPKRLVGGPGFGGRLD